MEYTNRYRAPNHSGPGFYYAGQAISYAASITDKPVVLCSQSGCTHSDSSCMAYIGDARQFAEYQGQWYAIVKNSDIEYTFLKIDPTTRERQTLGHWIVEEQDILHVYGGRLAHGYAYVYIYQEKYNAQEIRFCPPRNIMNGFRSQLVRTKYFLLMVVFWQPRRHMCSRLIASMTMKKI